MAEIYPSLSSKQVEPFPKKPDGVTITRAIDDTLFIRGFEDDTTPLDQSNLNLLIRAIKENLISIENNSDSIEQNKSTSDVEIQTIKDNYLTTEKLIQFFTAGSPLSIGKEVVFNGKVFVPNVSVDSDISSSDISGRIANLKYIHSVLENLVLKIDGGGAEEAEKGLW